VTRLLLASVALALSLLTASTVSVADACAKCPGECRPRTACKAPDTAKSGLCPGSSQITCCISAATRCAGRKGVCQNRASCTGAFTATSGLCPGPANITCCIPK
jgi:hypothetical protein